MYLFIATDNSLKHERLWYIGGSDSRVSKIKELLKLNKRGASVDLVVKSEHITDILVKLREKLHVKSEHIINGTPVLLVKGDHGHLANFIYDIAIEFETERRSFRRSLVKWFTSVNV